jgi:hypothetical protein
MPRRDNLHATSRTQVPLVHQVYGAPFASISFRVTKCAEDLRTLLVALFIASHDVRLEAYKVMPPPRSVPPHGIQGQYRIPNTQVQSLDATCSKYVRNTLTRRARISCVLANSTCANPVSSVSNQSSPSTGPRYVHVFDDTAELAPEICESRARDVRRQPTDPEHTRWTASLHLRLSSSTIAVDLAKGTGDNVYGWFSVHSMRRASQYLLKPIIVQIYEKRVF